MVFGQVVEMPYEGTYVPAMNILYDLNEDGKPDVSFVDHMPDNKVAGVIYILIDNTAFSLSEGTKGNLLWRPGQPKEW